MQGLLLAQNNPVGSDNIELTTERIEDVIDASRPEVTPPPSPPPTKQKTDDLTFEAQEVYIHTDFKATQPNMLPLAKEPFTPPANNYAKLGFGRYATPLVKVWFANAEKENTRYGVDFTHFSAHADTLKLRNFREDYGGIWGNTTYKKVALGGKASFYNAAYWHYADTTTFASEAARKDSLRMGFTRIELRGNVASSDRASKKFRYYVPAGLQLYSDRYSNTEADLGINPQISYHPSDKVQLQVAAAGNVIFGTIGDTSASRSLLDVTAKLSYTHGNRLWISGGYRYGFFRNQSESAGVSLHVPLAEVRYMVLPEQLSVAAGVTGGLTHQRYADLMATNRFLADSVALKATREKWNLYATLNGNIKSKFNYNVRFFYRQVLNQPIFYAAPSMAYFTVLYDSLTKNFGINVEGNYQVQGKWTTGFVIRYNHFSTFDTSLRVFHIPPMYMELNGSFSPIKKLTLRTAIFVYGATPMTVTSDGAINTRSTVPDLNLEAMYQIGSRFSVWAEANNLLNVSYNRWINYLERPLDYKFGISVSF